MARAAAAPASSHSTRAAAAAPAKPRTSRSAAAAPAKRAPARRRSGPAPAPRRSRPAAPRRPAQPLGKVVAARGNLLLDRLLRGRLWVGCVGVLLAGIVSLNVGLLQLNDQIARTDKRSGSIGRENAALRIKLAKLDSTERIQRLAEAKGFVMPAPGAVRYVRSKPRDARNAAHRTVAPQPPAPPLPQAAPVPGAGAPGTAAGTPGVAPPGTTPGTVAPAQPAPAAGTAPATGAPAAAAPTAAAPATAQQIP